MMKLKKPLFDIFITASTLVTLLVSGTGVLLPQSVESVAHFSWTNIQTSITREQIDLWTEKASGCTCPHDLLDTESCACCVSNGCQCGHSNPQRCAQCGLEQYCDNMCNITISSQQIRSRSQSGQMFGEIKSPSTLSGPQFCWYRFEAEEGYRVELQVYRIKRVGRRHVETNKCIGGFLQFVNGDKLDHRQNEMSLCGANKRYSPPVVMFRDFVQQDQILSSDLDNTEIQQSEFYSRRKVAMLLFKVEETTTQSQFLAHYSFTPIGKTPEGTAFHIRGGKVKLRKNSTFAFSSEEEKEDDIYSEDCDWIFDEKTCLDNGNRCQIASPGFPGVYPPRRKCRYLFKLNKGTTIRFNFTHFNLPPELCETHSVTIYGGEAAIDPIVNSLCGFRDRESINYSGGSKLLVEFSSGNIIPPITYNGFVAKVEFLANQQHRKNENNGSGKRRNNNKDKSGKGRRKQKGNKNKYNNNRNQATSSNNKSKEKDNNRKHKTHSSKDGIDESDSSRCILEFKANESRSGMMNSNNLPKLKNRACTIIFRGNPGDVLLLHLETYKLRGKSCEAYISITTPRRPRTSYSRRKNEKSKPEEEVAHICSPTTRRIYDQDREYFPRPPLLINSSLVYMEFQTNRAKQNVDRFEGSFQFHDVLTDGLPVVNKTCDVIFPGRTGKSKGYISSPNLVVPNENSKISNEVTSILKNHQGPLSCTSSFVPTDAQSVTLTIKTSGPDLQRHSGSRRYGEDRCETLCDENGCHCLLDNDVPLRLIDHIMVSPFQGGRIACFCGHFAHLLPLNIISSSSVKITYNSINFKESTNFGYSAEYKFHNEETCGTRRISTKIGSLESPLSASPIQSYHQSSTYFYQNCQWFFDPPPAKELLMKISTTQTMADCQTWNASIAIWNTSLPNQMGTLIDRFCPDIKAKEYSLDISEKKIVIGIHSLATGPIHYRINWQAKGIPQRNGFASTNIDTKEVILGKSDSGSNSGGGISFIGVSSATPTIFHLQAQHGRIIALFHISAFFFTQMMRILLS